MSVSAATSNGHGVPAALTALAVSKQFVIHRRPTRTIRESFIRRFGGGGHALDTVWALRDVSFEVRQGRALGIVGHNGAGKSTLLRLLCGLGRPTSGRIRRRGTLSGVLELGGGFHLDVSGRDNILTAGLLHGLTEQEVRARERDIVAFAELEDVIDHPVRTYSTGMYLRLAFAVAVCLDPAILVVDEALAVGDSRFQQKCLERITALRAAGRTLIITSHSRDQIVRLCDEVLVLDAGRVVMQGDPTSALGCFEELMRQRTERRRRQLYGADALPPAPATGSRHGTQEASIEAVRVLDRHGIADDGVRPDDHVDLELDYSIQDGVTDLALSVGIYSDAHVKCFEALVPSAAITFGALGTAGTLRCRLPSLPLLPGRYYVNVGCYPPDWKYAYDYHWQMHPLDVVCDDAGDTERSGVVALRPSWQLVRHVGRGEPLAGGEQDQGDICLRGA